MTHTNLQILNIQLFLANFFKSLVNKQHKGTVHNVAVAVEMITSVWSCLLSFTQIGLVWP